MARPVILVVDDDRAELAALEQDLGRRYGEEYEILGVDCVDQALESLRALDADQRSVALLLFDRRLPGKTGTELLAEGRRRLPNALRVLLVDHTDTAAAIAEIPVASLDHFLLKPWTPPEEKLYPSLDDLLQQWRERNLSAFDGIRIAGSRWSPKSYEAKEFLSRNRVPYRWVDIDRDEAMRARVEALGGGKIRLPVVFLPDQEPLVAPTPLELADRVGLHTEASRPFYDLVVVGCGPAGLANAVYGASEGLRTLAIERSAPGGQAGTSSMIENYLGFPAGVTGEDLAQRAVAQAAKFGAELVTAQEVLGIRRNDPYRTVLLGDGSEVDSYAVVIATGTKVKRIEAPGIDRFLGTGVFYGAAMTEAATFRGQDICVVGGANSAGQGALYFSRYVRKVTMLVRAPSLSPGMSQYLVDRIEAADNIEGIGGVEVVEVLGESRLERVRYREIESGREAEIPALAMFLFVGGQPRTECFRDLLAHDERGFLLTGPDLPRVDGRIPGWTLDRDPLMFETSVPGIFAAGDCRAGANRRVAAAVGEGSAAIYSVHRYLQTV